MGGDAQGGPAVDLCGPGSVAAPARGGHRHRRPQFQLCGRWASRRGGPASQAIGPTARSVSTAPRR